MSLASGVTHAGSFIYGCLHNDGGFHARTGFPKNLGLFHKNQNFRLLKSSRVHRLCRWRDGSNHVAASFCTASSFNDSVGDFKDCGRIEGEKKGATNRDKSDTSNGYGHGNGDSRGYRGGGGDNGGTGSGGLGESADWEGLRWLCWQIYKAWKYYKNLAKVSSFVVAGVNNIHVYIEESLNKMVEMNFNGLQQSLELLLLAIFMVLIFPVMFIAVAFCATLLAGVLLFGCVVAVLIWFWRSRQSPQP